MLCRRMCVSRPVRLLKSTLVQVPSVIGVLRPVILLPVGAFTGLSPDQIEAILAHELAHIKRYDYLVNIVQSVIEILFFYHPAVWWVSHRIRVERENCCDDIAASVCGDPETYVRTLVVLEEARCPAPVLSVAANGGSLVLRVQRLVSEERKGHGGSGWESVVTILVVMLGAVLLSTYTRATPADTLGQASRFIYEDPSQLAIDNRAYFDFADRVFCDVRLGDRIEDVIETYGKSAFPTYANEVVAERPYTGSYRDRYDYRYRTGDTVIHTIDGKVVNLFSKSTHIQTDKGLKRGDTRERLVELYGPPESTFNGGRALNYFFDDIRAVVFLTSADTVSHLEVLNAIEPPRTRVVP